MTQLPTAFRVVVWLIVLWSLVVALQWTLASALDLGTTDYGFHIFYHLFLNYELLGWLSLVVCVVTTLLLSTRVRTGAEALAQRLSQPRALYGLAAGATGLLWLGTLFVHHSYPFSMDEFGALFQARILLTGKLTAPLPLAWQPYAAALTPVFVAFDAAKATWISGYLPVYAALRAAFLTVGLSDLLNPLLAGASVLLIADCARRLWPDEPHVPFVASALLVSSAQFLATSISFYSMPAHLCANLLWLSLYLRNTRGALALAPWVGGLAVGLHQPVVHALFVIPFCLDIVWQRRFALAAYFAAVYLGFLGLWYWWQKQLVFQAEHAAYTANLFRLPDAIGLLTQSVNLTLLFSWQSAAFALSFLIALGQLRSLSAPLRNLLFGVILTFLLYVFFYTNQGHGWGYRYAYGVLGNLVLLAALGFLRSAAWLGRARALQLLGVSTLLALAVQVPLRAFEVERTIRPFARARDLLASVKEDIVIVDHRFIWYGQDLIRNDPRFEQHPVVLNAAGLNAELMRGLARLGSVRVVTPRELVALDMIASSQLVQALSKESAARE